MIGHSFNNPERTLAFFNEILQSRKRLGPDASHFVESDIIIVKLQLQCVDECRLLLDDAKDSLKQIASNEAVVHSKFYRAEVEFRKVRHSLCVIDCSLLMLC